MLPTNLQQVPPAQITVLVENSPGIFSKSVQNMKGFSLVEKTAVVALSMLLGVACTLGSIGISGPLHFYAMAFAVIVPALSMYFLSDLLKAVKMYIRDFNKIDGQ